MLVPPDVVFVRARLAGGAAADRSNGDDVSCRLTFFSNPCSSDSLAVLIIARRACVDDMSIKGGRIALAGNGGNIAEKSGFLLFSSLDVVGRFCMILVKVVGLNLGSKGGGNPFLTAVK